MREFLLGQMDYISFIAGLLLILFLVFFVFPYSRIRGMFTLYKKFVFIWLGALLLLLVAGWFFVNWSGEQETAKERAKIIGLAQQIVPSINVRQVQGLVAGVEDLQSLAYQHLKSQLQSLRKVDPRIRFVYLMRKINGQVVFLVDSETPGSKDESPPGQVYTEAPPGLVAAFVSGKPVVEGPSVDRWGTWISGFSPLNDPRTGELTAMLGVDQNAHDYLSHIAFERLKALVFPGLLCIAAVLIFIYYRRFAGVVSSHEEVSDPLFRWGALGFVVFFGLALTIMLFIKEQGRERESFQEIFLQRAAGRVESLAQSLDLQIDRLQGVQRLFENVAVVERHKFSRFVAPITADVPLQALEWIPRVRGVERVDAEIRARQDGLAGFEIREKDAGGKSVPAAQRDEYFPVYFVEPLTGNEAALGFDLASNPARREAMDKSRDEGRAVVTAPVRLVQAAGDTSGFLVFVPVYGQGEIPQTVAERRRDLQGFILGVYRGEAFLKGIYSRLPAEGLACLIEDLEAPLENRVLYRHQVRIGTVDWNNPWLKYEVPLLIAEREWRVTIVPGSAFIKVNWSSEFVWILPLGMLMTGLAALFLNMLMVGRSRLEVLVRQRTKELNQEKEALARNKESLEQAVQVKSNFVATVSHELRTPLAAIKSSIDILDSEIPGKLGGEQKVFIGRVKQSINRLMNLVNDVLDLSRFESGNLVLDLAPLQPLAVVNEVVETLRSAAESKGFRLEIRSGAELPLMTADRARLIQVLNNLIGNAIKFTRQGMVEVSVSCDAKKEMVFSVRDTGGGISETDMPKLFQKFYQAGEAAEQVGGTGLGLAICKEIVELMGGRIWVESTPGQGSVFFFSIPAR
ncbi:MAG: CHASE domain-containing protein [Candidatus Omnitrophica bacterium]|nr:CHASE domain-containing protein [Candidatus Omnitrophota bacterium]